MRSIIRFLVFLAFSANFFATVEIRMKNGDIITGHNFIFIRDSLCRLEYYGTEIALPWEAILQINLQEKYYVVLDDNNKLVGKSGLSATQQLEKPFLTVEIAEKQVINVEQNKIKTIKSADVVLAEIKAQEEESTRGLGKYWSGDVDLGYQAFSGNTDENLVGYRLLGTRESDQDKTTLELSGMKGKRLGIESQNQNKAGMRFDLKHKPNRSYFMLSTLEYDKIKKIDQRTVLGAGVGFTFVNRPRRLFKMSFGVTADRELRMDDTKRELTTALVGAEFKMPIFFNSNLEVVANLYPDLNDLEKNLKFDSRAALLTPISDNVSLRTGLQLSYQDDVLPGIKKMDTVLTTGLSYKF